MALAFYLHFFYSVPSLILYSLSIFVILRDRRDLKGPFYTIYKFSFFVDVLSYLSNFVSIWILVFRNLNDWLLSLNQYPLLLSAILYSNKVTLHAQNIRCILSCFHRLTSVAFPMNRFWDRMTVPLLCLVPFWGLTIGIYAWFQGAHYKETDDQVFWAFENAQIVVYPILSMSIFYTVMICTPNTFTIGLLLKHKREAIAVNICLITLCCTFIQVINLLTMVSPSTPFAVTWLQGAIGLSELKGWDLAQFIELNLLPLTRDAYSFSTPWFTFLINRDVHRRILSLLRREDTLNGTQSSSGTFYGPSSTKALPLANSERQLNSLN